MNRVGAGERTLLLVARAVVGQVAPAAIEDTLATSRSVPESLGPTAARLLKETLARGTVLALGRRGALPARHLSAGRVVGGRLWERHEAPALDFSARSFALLRGLAALPLADAACAQIALPGGDATPADDLLVSLAADLVAQTRAVPALARQDVFLSSPLTALAFPRGRGDRPVPSFAAWMEGTGALILEALQGDLARRWSVRPLPSGAPAAVAVTGRAEEAVLTAFLNAADAAGRRDLALFLVDAARRAPALDVPVFDPGTPLSERAGALHALGAFPRALLRIEQWAERERSVRFFDEGYDAAQLLLGRVEILGPGGFRQVEDGLRRLQALDAAAGGTP